MPSLPGKALRTLVDIARLVLCEKKIVLKGIELRSYRSSMIWVYSSFLKGSPRYFSRWYFKQMTFVVIGALRVKVCNVCHLWNTDFIPLLYEFLKLILKSSHKFCLFWIIAIFLLFASGVTFMLLLSSADFFQYKFFFSKKSSDQEHYQIVQLFGTRSGEPVFPSWSGSQLFISRWQARKELTLKVPRKKCIWKCRLLKSSAANNCLALLTN